MLTRVEHWDTRAFHTFLLERAEEPFAWGKNDCALFVADGIEAITGTDIAAEFRGKYETEAEALELVRSITGGEGVEAAAAWCAARHGLPEWERPLGAQRGDLVVLADEGRMIAGLIHLSGRHVVAVGESGLKRLALIRIDADTGLPVCTIARAWHV